MEMEDGDVMKKFKFKITDKEIDKLLARECNNPEVCFGWIFFLSFLLLVGKWYFFRSSQSIRVWNGWEWTLNYYDLWHACSWMDLAMIFRLLLMNIMKYKWFLQTAIINRIWIFNACKLPFEITNINRNRLENNVIYVQCCEIVKLQRKNSIRFNFYWFRKYFVFILLQMDTFAFCHFVF